MIKDHDLDNRLLILKLQGYQLHEKQSILKGAVYTWFQPIGDYDHDMYLATYSDFMGREYNVMRSISSLTRFLEEREEE